MPTFTPSTSMNGSGKGIGSFSKYTKKPSKATGITWVWLLSSILFMYLGWRLCRYDAMSVSIKCDQRICQFKERNVGHVYSRLEVERRDLIGESAKQVRVNKKMQYINTENMKRREKRGLKWAYSVEYREHPPRETGGEVKVKTVLFGNFGIGRKRSRKNAQRLAMYLNGDVEKLDLKESREFTFRGAFTIVISLFSLLLCLVFGQFDDENVKRLMGPGSKRGRGGGEGEFYRKHATNANANGRW